MTTAGPESARAPADQTLMRIGGNHRRNVVAAVHRQPSTS
ncbi:hypothetical protein I553_10232 [Mycobacterium xenopi 4042]|uniref:Uncharacterized protein n=1 Tax=Mycobacterium xenopi 4042 TaxID=1299334 RepID=X8ANG7_MYCXE|nr:hypothetical protein I553_10232 [Mycobacterium xenopi 4042]